MNQNLIKQLKELPEIKQLITFIALECKKLDNLVDIKVESAIDCAVEVRARQVAYNKLVDILAPFVDFQELDKASKDEYVV